MQPDPIVRIVDDDADHCEGLNFLLLTAGFKAKTYTSAESFLAHDDLSIPGCIILDYLMPGINGIELQELLLRRGCMRPILFLTAHADVDMAISIFKKGANDLLKKPIDPQKFLAAITGAIARDVASYNRPDNAYQQKFLLLTPRERQIVQLVAAGLMNSQVAKRFSVSERTVETHRANAYRKLGITCYSELMAFMRHIESRL